MQLILPQCCLACGTPPEPLCRRCRDRLHRLNGPLCARCGAPTAWPVARCRECAGRRLAFEQARAAVAYDRSVRQLVHGWKERGLRTLATTAAELVAEVVPPPQAHALTWIPSEPDRLLRRGHSTAEQLARRLARGWQLEPVDLLERTRVVAPQRSLDIARRRRNVAGAFRSRRRAPLRVGLVDDVYTTGATVSAAATALRKGGARHVVVVTFARTLRSLD